MPEPVHPEDYSFEIFGEVENPMTYTLDDLRKLPGHTVRAVTECAGDDTEFWDYLESRAKGGNIPKPSRRVSEDVEGVDWHGMADRGELDLDELEFYDSSHLHRVWRGMDRHAAQGSPGPGRP